MARHTMNSSEMPEDDIFNSKMNVSCLDFLLIELVPLVQRIVNQRHVREQALLEDWERSKMISKSNLTTSNLTTSANISISNNNKNNKNNNASDTLHQERGSLGATTQPAIETVVSTAPSDTTTTTPTYVPPARRNDPTAAREAVHWRLDSLGYRVGQGLVECFSPGKPRPSTALEAIKFICKDLWTVLFRKQMDNLKTNHRGVFVLTDARFQPMSRMSVDRRAGTRAAEDTLARGQAYLYFPCGVIRGALQGLGLDITVTAESTEIPAATFQIRTKGAKS